MTARFPQRQFHGSPWPDGHPFALALTHDVDLVSKTFQYVTHLRKAGGLRKLFSASRENPYWNFDRIVALEKDLGVRSTFFFLQETRGLRRVRPGLVAKGLGRYRFDEPAVAQAIRALDAGGWEVGLHGSFDSFRDARLLGGEKSDLEAVLGHAVKGVRQHFLNLEIPGTWRIQEGVGFEYDATLGSRSRIGFLDIPAHPFAPFDGRFLSIPLAVMDGPLFAAFRTKSDRLQELGRILDDAERRRGLLTILWHQRFLNPKEFPEEHALYEEFVRSALHRGPWVATTGDVASWWRDRILEVGPEWNQRISIPT